VPLQDQVPLKGFGNRYNRNRRHSTLDYLTPEEAELRYRHELPLVA